MKSKKPLFNKTLFYKAITGMWPLWVLSTVFGILSALSKTVDVKTFLRGGGKYEPAEILYSFYQASTNAVPYAAFFLSMLVAIGIWKFLFSKRSVTFFHSLPESRNCIFVTYLISGYLMISGPLLVSALTLFAAYGILGFVCVKGLLVLCGVILVESLLFYSLALLSVQIAGELISFIFIYGLLNFGFFCTSWIVKCLMADLYFGVNADDVFDATYLSPMAKIVNSVKSNLYFKDRLSSTGEYLSSYAESATFTGAGVLLIFVPVSLLLLALSWFLYSQRKSEASSEFLAISKLKPVLLYSVSFVCALGLGQLIYGMFDNEGFPVFSLGPIIVSIIFSGAICYYCGRIIIERDIRVFKAKNNIGFVALSVVLAGTVIFLWLDPYKKQSYIPEVDEIKYLEFTCIDDVYIITEDEKGLLELVMDSQKALIERGPQTGEDWYCTDDSYYTHFIYRYELKNGEEVYRNYNVRIAEDAEYVEGSVESKLYELINLRPMREKEMLVSIPGFSIDYVAIRLSDGENSKDYTLDRSQFDSFIKAVSEDVSADHMGQRTISGRYDAKYYDYECSVYVDCERPSFSDDIRDNHVNYYLCKQYQLTKEMTATIDYFKSIGIDCDGFLE